jgi:hypothetical protein
MTWPHTEKESPDPLGGEVGADGIEALPQRVQRYGEAKRKALDVAEYMRGLGAEQRRTAALVEGCGEWLLFRHYFTADRVRLHGASFCRKALLCPLCAIRRGAKALEAYMARYEAVRASRPDLSPFLITLTVKDGADLAERFRHLRGALRELRKRHHRGRGAWWDCIEAGVWSYETKRGQGSGLWHPHVHMVALAQAMPDAARLAAEWQEITGDSHVVDVRPMSEAQALGGFLEVFKYALKFSDMEPADVVQAWAVLAGRRLIGSSGLFRGVEVPEALTDAPLDALPYVQFFFRYLAGGYTLTGRSGRLPASPRAQPSAFARIMTSRGYGAA